MSNEQLEFDPRSSVLDHDESIIKTDNLSAIKHCIEYYKDKSTYYGYQPLTKKEFLQVLAEIEKDVLRAIRESRRE